MCRVLTYSRSHNLCVRDLTYSRSHILCVRDLTYSAGYIPGCIPFFMWSMFWYGCAHGCSDSTEIIQWQVVVLPPLDTGPPVHFAVAHLFRLNKLLFLWFPLFPAYGVAICTRGVSHLPCKVPKQLCSAPDEFRVPDLCSPKCSPATLIQVFINVRV